MGGAGKENIWEWPWEARDGIRSIGHRKPELPYMGDHAETRKTPRDREEEDRGAANPADFDVRLWLSGSRHTTHSGTRYL